MPGPFSVLTRRVLTFTPLASDGQTAWPWLRGMALSKQKWFLLIFLFLSLIFLGAANWFIFVNSRVVEKSASLQLAVYADQVFWQETPDNWTDHEVTLAINRGKLLATIPELGVYSASTSPWRDKVTQFKQLSGFLSQQWPDAPKSAWVGLWRGDQNAVAAWQRFWPDVQSWVPVFVAFQEFRTGLSEQHVGLQPVYAFWLIGAMFVLVFLCAWISVVGSMRLLSAQTEQARGALEQERRLMQQYMQDLRQQLQGWLKGSWNERLPQQGGWLDVLSQLLNQFWDLLGQRIKAPYTQHDQMMNVVLNILNNTRACLQYQEKLLNDLSAFSKNVFLLIQHNVSLPSPSLADNLRKSCEKLQDWQASQQDFWLSGKENFKHVETTVERLKQQEAQKNAEDVKIAGQLNQLSLLLMGLETVNTDLREPRKISQNLQQVLAGRLQRSKEGTTLLQGLGQTHQQFWAGVSTQQEKWMVLEPELDDFSEQATFLSRQITAALEQMGKQREVVEKLLTSLHGLLEGADRQTPLWQSWRQLMTQLSDRIHGSQAAWKVLMITGEGQDDARR